MCNKRLRFRTARVENHSYYLDLFPKASNWADKKSIYEVTSERQALSTHIYLQKLLENQNNCLYLFLAFLAKRPPIVLIRSPSKYEVTLERQTLSTHISRKI